jgi:hypothetical protein
MAHDKTYMMGSTQVRVPTARTLGAHAIHQPTRAWTHLKFLISPEELPDQVTVG